MQASRRLWEEGSRVLYGENQFRFHIGSENFNTTLLNQRTTDLMRDIEITLHPSNAATAQETLRVLQLFGTPQVMRRSCLVKLRLFKVELMNNNNNMIEALKKMTGFKILIFEVKVPAVAGRRSPGIWTSHCLGLGTFGVRADELDTGNGRWHLC